MACSPDYSKTSIPNGITVCNGNSFSDQCTFRCYTGYDLVGPSITICFSDGNDADGIGEWSGTAPTCQGGLKINASKIQSAPANPDTGQSGFPPYTDE